MKIQKKLRQLEAGTCCGERGFSLFDTSVNGQAGKGVLLDLHSSGLLTDV